jgi:hypothetical protein
MNHRTATPGVARRGVADRALVRTRAGLMTRAEIPVLAEEQDSTPAHNDTGKPKTPIDMVIGKHLDENDEKSEGV